MAAMTQTDDFATVQSCLVYWRRFALGHRYGMIGQQAQQTQDALEALERLREPQLFQWRAREDEQQVEL